jgi:hypothetical protein
VPTDIAALTVRASNVSSGSETSLCPNPRGIGRDRGFEGAGERQEADVRRVDHRQHGEVQRWVLRPPVAAVEHALGVGQRSERRDRVDRPVVVGVRDAPGDAGETEDGRDHGDREDLGARTAVPEEADGGHEW